VGAETVREVEPGELVVIADGRLESRRPWGAAIRPAVCAFEEVYFARPDSRMGGRTVHDTRRALGAELAREAPADADVVVGVPDSSIPAAIGYAEALGLPFDMGLVKNRYVGRSFIQPGQAARDTAVVQKLAAVDSVVAGRRVVLVDDSLVRGTTARHLIQLLRQAGAVRVHMRSASPPYIRSCHYGIDTSRSEELAAARHDVETIRRLSGADSLQYLSMDGLMRALGRDGWCLACFGGPYPVPVEQDVVHHVP
jgi:amidophosphoribosyltransferase